MPSRWYNEKNGLRWERRYGLLAVVLLAILYKLASPAFISGHLQLYGVTPWDSATYYEPALRWSHSIPFHSEVRTPGYPAFLALLYKWTGDPDPLSNNNLTLLFAAQGILVSLGCIPIFYAIRHLTGGERLSLLGGLLWAVNNSARYYSNYLLTEALSAFLICLFVYCLAREIKDDRGYWYAPIGVILFVLTLVRPSASLLAVPTTAGLFLNDYCFQRRRDYRRLTAMAVLVLVVPMSCPGLWSLRNSIVEGQRYYCRLSMFGIYAYGIANPSDLADGKDLVVSHREHWNEFFRLLKTMPPREMDRMYEARILQGIRRHPVPIAVNFIESVAHLFLPTMDKPMGRYRSDYHFRDALKPAFWTPMTPGQRAAFAFFLLNSALEFALLIGMLLLILSRLRPGRFPVSLHSRGFIAAALLILAYWLAVHAISAMDGEGARFLLPIMPVIIVAAAVAASEIGWLSPPGRSAKAPMISQAAHDL